MTPADPKSPRATTSRPFRWLTGILTGVLLAMLVIGTALWAFTGFGLFEFGRMLRGGQVHISVDQPTVIHQIRALQRLETVGYTMDKIISGERENPILPRVLAGDRLLLVVHGEVIAGMGSVEASAQRCRRKWAQRFDSPAASRNLHHSPRQR